MAKLAAMHGRGRPDQAQHAAAIAALHALGLKVTMITGDNRPHRPGHCPPLGIDEVVAEVLPEGKVQAVQQPEQSHGTLAFVGDGINDAPRWPQADVGIAIGTGTDIAVEAADVVLMSGDLAGRAEGDCAVPGHHGQYRAEPVLGLCLQRGADSAGRRVLYPVNGMLLSPMFAAGAMALSSVFVVSNALRLRRFQP